jgi:curved DNA-binding protein CbpA
LEDLEPIAVASDSASEVKKAYLKAARVIHPDKLTGASLEVS